MSYIFDLEVYTEVVLSIHMSSYKNLAGWTAIYWLLVCISSLYLQCFGIWLFLVLFHHVLVSFKILWNYLHHVRECYYWNLLLLSFFLFILFSCVCKHLGYHKMLQSLILISDHKNHSRYQAPNSAIRVVKQHGLIVSYHRFGTTNHPHLQGSSSLEDGRDRLSQNIVN